MNAPQANIFRTRRAEDAPTSRMCAEQEEGGKKGGVGEAREEGTQRASLICKLFLLPAPTRLSSTLSGYHSHLWGC